MSQSMTKVLLAAVLLNLIAAGYLHASNDPLFTFQHGRLVARLSADEVKEYQDDLGQVSAGHVPEGAQGGVLFDGVVIRRLPDDRFGQPSWKVRITKGYLGSSNLSGQEIDLKTPILADGGVSLRPAEQARFFSVKFDNCFYIWKGTVLPLSSI
jgi:hypothetical protein